MLVIRRRSGESLLIGGDVELEILDISASHVKLGISAPPEVTVLRKEIHLTTQQNRTASRAVPEAAVARLLGTFKKIP
jgi:carbon storage regulator